MGRRCQPRAGLGSGGDRGGRRGVRPDRAGELHERLGSYLWEAADYDGSAAAYAEADRLLAGRPPSAVASRVQSALATSAIRSGNYLLGAGTGPPRAPSWPPRWARAPRKDGRSTASAWRWTLHGESEDGERALRDALAIATEVDHLEDLLRAYGNLGVCLEHAGRLEDTVTAMTEGLAKAEEYGLVQTRQGGVLANIAAAALFVAGPVRRGRRTAGLGAAGPAGRGEPVRPADPGRGLRRAGRALANAERLLNEIRYPSERRSTVARPALRLPRGRGRVAGQARRGTRDRGARRRGCRRGTQPARHRPTVRRRSAHRRRSAQERTRRRTARCRLGRRTGDRGAVRGGDQSGEPWTRSACWRGCARRNTRARAARTRPGSGGRSPPAGTPSTSPGGEAYALARQAFAAARTGDRKLANACVKAGARDRRGDRRRRRCAASSRRRPTALKLRLGEPRPYGLTATATQGSAGARAGQNQPGNRHGCSALRRTPSTSTSAPSCGKWRPPTAARPRIGRAERGWHPS